MLVGLIINDNLGPLTLGVKVKAEGNLASLLVESLRPTRRALD